jgi:hypothetical protein
MATSKQIKMYMTANNATREEAEAFYSRAYQPAEDEISAALTQNGIQKVKVVSVVEGTHMAMGLPALIDCNKDVLTDGVANYMVLKGTSSMPTFRGTTKRGAFYKCQQMMVEQSAIGKNEWYVVLENLKDQSQLIMGFIGKRKPKTSDAFPMFEKLLSALMEIDDVEAVRYVSSTFTGQPLRCDVYDGNQSGLGLIGWVDYQ